MSSASWLGKDEHGGVPSQVRPDFSPPPSWRLEDVFATPRPHDLAVSPDGSRIAYVFSTEGTSDIWISDASGAAPSRLTASRELTSYWEDTTPEWSPSGDQIAFASGDEGFVVSAAGGPPQTLGQVTPVGWLDESRLVVVVERERVSRLATIDIADPWPQPFGPDDGDVSHIRVVDRHRVLATFWPKDDRNRADIILAEAEGKWATLVGHPDRRATGAAISGDTIAYLLETGDWTAVYLTDLDGADHHLLAQDDADFADLDWHADGGHLVATRAARGQSDLVTIDLDGTVTVLSEGGFWQTPHWMSGSVAAVHESATSAPRLVLVDDAERPLHDPIPLAVRRAPHVRFERISYSSLDDTEIEGFLFKPSDTAGPVPAVVYPHGGPTDAYGDGWDGHAQYFIDKGYAWLAFNFRGSTNYGLAFERANHDDWGVGDTADCIAAGHYLQSLNWIDGDRLAIFGASYGSYMALASLVHLDNPFVCGVAKYGDCDILTSWAQGDRAGGDDLERMMGHPSENLESYRRGSPIQAIERIEQPILVAHGEQDRRVHVQQAEQLVAALRRLGKTYEYVTYPTEGHGFLRREPQLDFYRRMEKFFDWYLI